MKTKRQKAERGIVMTEEAELPNDPPNEPAGGVFGFLVRPFSHTSEAWARSVEVSGGFIPTVIIAWVLEFIYGLTCEGWLGGVRIFCILWFVSGAAFFMGTIGGFLFGIPKARSAPAVPDPAIPPPQVPAETTGYRDNTNLEEVSDWLTKIIVGLGLVEFRKIASAVMAAGAAAGDAIDPFHRFGGTAIATGSLIVGFAIGFLYYYLWARVFLMKRLVRFAAHGR